MRMHLIFGLAAASLMTVPATAAARGEGAASSSAGAAATTSKPTKAEKKICRRYEKPGSHASEKICLTRAQWDKIEREF